MEVCFTLKNAAICSSETYVIIYRATLLWHVIQQAAISMRCSLYRKLAQYPHTRTHLRVMPQLTGSYIIDLNLIRPVNEQHRETSPKFFVSGRALSHSLVRHQHYSYCKVGIFPHICVDLNMATRRNPTKEVPFRQSLTSIGTLPKVTASPYTCQQHCVVLSDTVKTTSTTGNCLFV